MKTADHCNTQSACHAQRTQPKRAFGGDVHHVRALYLPALHQATGGGHAPLQSRITGDRPAPAQHHLIVTALIAIAGLTRAHQLHMVIASAQAIKQTPKGVGHAIYFWWKRFGDQGNMQSSCHGTSLNVICVGYVSAK